MKYLNSKTLTKLISLLIVLFFLLTCSGCQKIEEENKPPEFTVDVAKALIRQDEIVTKIFICNGLCGEEDVFDYVAVDEESQYSSFEELLWLVDSTYLPDSGDKDYFLSYPEIGDKSVIERDGKTYVFKHKGSGFNDFIDVETVSVEDTDVETEKTIKAITETGREVKMTAVLNEDNWLLKRGHYRMSEQPPFEVTFPNTNLGSLSKFSGSVLVIKLFVSDLKTSFTEEEEAEFGKRVETAANFIQSEAKRYGNNVNLTISSAYFHHNGFISDRILDFDTDFAETGFGNLKKFAEANYDLNRYDNYFFVVCFNKELETSWERYEGTKETMHYFGERICIGTNTTDYEIAISTLNLLGAVDFAEEDCDDYLKSLYNRYFPNDVFSKGALADASITPFNAYQCGIIKDLERIYRVFNYEKDKTPEESEEPDESQENEQSEENENG